MLTIITFFPLVAAIGLLFLNPRALETIRRYALGVSLVELLLTLVLYAGFTPATAAMQDTEQYPWIPQLGISYHLGVDGLSLFLILLMAFLTTLSILSSWRSVQEHVRAFFFFVLMLETSVIGVFVSLDLVLFYIFWEAMLIPMYFMIGAWGGPRRVAAAVKFFIYTIAASLLMLVAIIAIKFAHGGQPTFDLLAIIQAGIRPQDQTWLFLAFALAFAVKVPLFPLHTWLPDAYVEAPTPGTVLLACVMSKVGAYGFLRFCLGLFPDASRQYAGLLGTLAVISILYGAYLAITRPDMKRLVAYSSLGHMGFMVLGIFALTPEGIAGSVLQMVNHGISTGVLFFLIAMLYDRYGTRLIPDLGGLHRAVPVLSFTMFIALLSSIALPGLNGFVGEFLILVGSFKGYPSAAYGVLAACGVVFAAVYIIWMYRRVFHGALLAPQIPGAAAVRDLSGRELAIVVPCIVLIIGLGVLPNILLSRIDASAQAWAAPGKVHLAVGPGSPGGAVVSVAAPAAPSSPNR